MITKEKGDKNMDNQQIQLTFKEKVAICKGSLAAILPFALGGGIIFFIAYLLMDLLWL